MSSHRPITDDGPPERSLDEWLAAFDESLRTGGGRLDGHADSDIGKHLISQGGEHDAPPDHLLGTLESTILRLERRWPRGTPPTSDGGAPTLTNTLQSVPPGTTIGRFGIERELGRGGFGVVFLAHDPKLERHVALKVPHPAALVTTQLRDRFLQEAKAAAALSHAGIVPIYEVGFAGPVFYTASEYCAGGSLADWLARRSQPVEPHEAAKMVMDLADAISHAHQRGVLHRDLKPSNVLLQAKSHGTHPSQASDRLSDRQPSDSTISSDVNQTEHDDFRLRITDFGLARLETSDDAFTQTGLIVGTPAYMAPEQADGRLGDSSPRTDVYSVGAILFELLAGQRAFDEATPLETLLAVVQSEVPSIRRICPRVPRDLEAVCHRCLQKDPKNRYQSAGDLTADLRRFLQGEPTYARPLGSGQRILRWSRRNPYAASLILFACVSAAGFIAASLRHANRLSAELAVQAQLRAVSEQQVDRLLESRYLGDMQLAHREILDGKIAKARERLQRYQPDQQMNDVRDFAWRILWRQANETALKLQHPGEALAVAASATNGLVATGARDGFLHLCSIDSGKLLARLQGHVGNVNAVAFAQHGSNLVTGADDGKLKLWRVDSVGIGGTPSLQVSVDAHVGDLLCLAVSPPNGKLIATGGLDKVIRLWESDSLTPVGELVGHSDWVRALDFSPDGMTLASGSDDGTIRIWNLVSRCEERRIDSQHEWVLSVRFHPDGCWLASAGKDSPVSLIRLWDVRTGELKQRLPAFNGWGRDLAFFSNGTRLAAVADDPRLAIFEQSPGDSFTFSKSFFADRYRNLSVASIDGQGWLATAGNSGAALWRIDGELIRNEIFALNGGAIDLRASTRSGFAFARVGSQKEHTKYVMKINTTTLQVEKQLECPGLFDLAVSPDGNVVVLRSSGPESTSDEIEVTDGNLANRINLNSAPGHCRGMAIDSTGRLLVAALPDESLRFWTLPGFESLKTIPKAAADPAGIAFGACGKRLLVNAFGARTATVWDVDKAEPIGKLSDVETVLATSPDGQTWAIATTDYSVVLYDVASLQPVLELVGHLSEITGAAFSPTEPILATAARNGVVRLWSLQSGEPLLQFDVGSGEGRLTMDLAFSADGNTLIAAETEQTKSARGAKIYAWRSVTPAGMEE